MQKHLYMNQVPSHPITPCNLAEPTKLLIKETTLVK